MKPTTCKEPGCDNPRDGASAYCREHFNARRRARYRGETLAKPTTCSVPGCDQPRHGKRARCAEHHRERERERGAARRAKLAQSKTQAMKRLVDENGKLITLVAKPHVMTDEYRNLEAILYQIFGWEFKDVS